MTRAGTPTTVVRAGTSRSTTAPAPMIAPAPILTPWITVAPIPKKAASPTLTRPANLAPGQIWAPRPIWHS
jgi:hypothetical protein